MYVPNGPELGFGEGVLVGYMGPVMGPRNPKVGQQQRDRLLCIDGPRSTWTMR